MYIESIPILLQPRNAKNSMHEFVKMCGIVSQITKKNKIIIACDILLSTLIFGSSSVEYYTLSFYRRSYKNRKTFMTTFSNLRVQKKLNDKEYIHYLSDKNEFNEKFAAFINRDWVDFNDDFEKVKDFIKKHDCIIIKPKRGHSGLRIFLMDILPGITDDEIKKIITGNDDCVAEEVLANHEDIATLNSSSLNTLRIITIFSCDNVELLFAGIRIGAQGAVIDNISSGGSSAAIDLDSGKIRSSFQGKKTNQTKETIIKDEIGFQIPCWQEVKQFVRKAALEIPQVRYIAWDVAITTKGLALIEGNHSSGNTINQDYFDYNEDGLKKKLDFIISRGKTK